MSLKKAYCPHCKTDKEKARIFEVNPEAEICFCPRCMAEMKPAEAISLYANFISNKADEAEKLLFRATGFNDAYKSFAEIINYEPTNVRALFGRALTLIFMSTLRNSKFNEAIEILKSESQHIYRKIKTIDLYTQFIVRANKALDEYNEVFRKRLTTRKRFYNIDCIQLFFVRLNEILQLKEFFLEELEFICSKHSSDESVAVLENVANSIKTIKSDLKTPVDGVDGYTYKLNNFSARKEAIITRGEKSNKPLTRNISYTLDDKEIKGRLIKDKVYPDNVYIRKLIKATTPLAAVFLLLALVVASMYLFINIDLKILFLIGGGLLLLGSLITLIVHLTWIRKLKKRSHLLLN